MRESTVTQAECCLWRIRLDSRLGDLRLFLVSRDSEFEQLKLLIGKPRRMQFGRSSEKAKSTDRTAGTAARSAASERCRDRCGDVGEDRGRGTGSRSVRARSRHSLSARKDPLLVIAAVWQL